jgi:hypothetical protein
MPRLGEFIGALLSDAAQARVRADMEALKIAEAYSAHDLLKHLPVPRFRLPDITVEFPVLVTAVEGAPPASGDRPFDRLSGAELTKVMRGALGESDIRLPTAVRDKVIAAVLVHANKVFDSGPQHLLSPSRVSGELAAGAAGEVKGVLRDREPDGPKLDAFEGRVRERFKALLLEKLVKSPFLEVSVASGDIKSHADNDSVMRMRLTITEDAYEVINRDEGQGFSLIPE